MKDVFQMKDCDIATSLPMEFKDIDGKKGIVTGYFASFGNVDSDGDIIKPGAFKKSINESGPLSSKARIKHILNHDWNQPLGVLKVLREDQKGLYYESQLGNHNLGVDFVKMADSGLITEHSIGYRTTKYNQVTPWADWREGEIARELTEVKLYEGSSLTFLGANQNTPLLGVKGLINEEKLSKRIDLIMKCLRNGTFTDETFDLLEIELKQLQQMIIDGTPVEKITPSKPDIKSTSDIVCPMCEGDMEPDADDASKAHCNKCGITMPKKMAPKRKAKSLSFSKIKFTDFLN